MKKIKYILILFLMFIGINNISAFDTSLKVYDYAQVLTPSEEANLRSKVNLFIANYNMDMVLVTVKNHNKTSTMNYADDFYDYNGFGIGPNYDGVIFVIDLKYGYKDVWMSTTGKAINYFTDARIDSILDAVATQKNNGYYKILEAFVAKTDYYAKLGIPTYSDSTNSTKWNINTILLISAIIPSIIIIIFILKNRMVKASTTAGEYLLKDSIVINKRNDRFITTHTTSVRINDSSSSGGSSIHRSSSGRSHGGGGRRL